MMQKIQKAMSKRGVAMVEYAVLLAFVCIVAAVYFGSSGNSLKSGIESRVSKTVSTIGTDTTNAS